MQVPKSSFLTAKEFCWENMRLADVHRELIMINDKDYSVIFNINDIQEPYEINYFERISNLMDVEKYIDTGFEAIHREIGVMNDY